MLDLPGNIRHYALVDSSKGEVILTGDASADKIIRDSIISNPQEFQHKFRIRSYDNLPGFFVHRIGKKEFIITGKVENGKLTAASLYNFQFFDKWLKIYNDLFGNLEGL